MAAARFIATLLGRMKPARTLPIGDRYRWPVVSRALAATLGGYALTSLLPLALSLLLPMAGGSQAEAVLATTVSSFIAYAAIIMAVFHACGAARAWLWLVVAAVPPVIITALLLPGAVR